MTSYVIRGPLTYELALKDSPVRQFFDDRLTPGLKDAQAAYRTAAGPMLIPGVPREPADAGTIATAADWMTRFMVHPNPSLPLAAQGPSLCGMLPALKELALMLGFRDAGVEEFTGPGRGSGTGPDLLYRACWGLALLTEVYRRGPAIAEIGPIGRLPRRCGKHGSDVAVHRWLVMLDRQGIGSTVLAGTERSPFVQAALDHPHMLNVSGRQKLAIAQQLSNLQKIWGVIALTNGTC